MAYNGGPTRTHELLPGSPAIDAGDPAAIAGLNGVAEYDQRREAVGFLRHKSSRVSGGRIDIGAYERQVITEGLPDSSIASLDVQLVSPVENEAGVVLNYDVSIANVRTVEITKDARHKSGGERVLSIGEVEFYGLDGSQLNIDPATVQVSQSTEWSAPLPANLAIDGLKNNFTHTGSEERPQWRIEFPANQAISLVRIHNRDDCCASRLSDLTVRYLDADGNEIYRSKTLNPNDVMSGPEFIDDGVNIVSAPSVNSIDRVRKVEISKDTSQLVGDARVLAMADIEFIAANGEKIDVSGVTTSQSSEWPSVRWERSEPLTALWGVSTRLGQQSRNGGEPSSQATARCGGTDPQPTRQ